MQPTFALIHIYLRNEAIRPTTFQEFNLKLMCGKIINHGTFRITFFREELILKNFVGGGFRNFKHANNKRKHEILMV